MSFKEITSDSEEYLPNITAYKEWKCCWKKNGDGDWKCISETGNEYWVATLRGWKTRATHDCVGIFSTIKLYDSLMFDKMLAYVFGKSVNKKETIMEYFEAKIKEYEKTK